MTIGHHECDRIGRACTEYYTVDVYIVLSTDSTVYTSWSTHDVACVGSGRRLLHHRRTKVVKPRYVGPARIASRAHLV